MCIKNTHLSTASLSTIPSTSVRSPSSGTADNTSKPTLHNGVIVVLLSICVLQQIVDLRVERFTVPVTLAAPGYTAFLR